jgi:hypothetical protein
MLGDEAEMDPARAFRVQSLWGHRARDPSVRVNGVLPKGWCTMTTRQTRPTSLHERPAPGRAAWIMVCSVAESFEKAESFGKTVAFRAATSVRSITGRSSDGEAGPSWLVLPAARVLGTVVGRPTVTVLSWAGQ